MHIQKLEFVDPLKLYGAIREEGLFPFILESTGKQKRKSKYTYISANPSFVVEVDGRGTRIDGKRVSKETNPFNALEDLHEQKLYGDRFVGGFVGYVSYDSVQNIIGGHAKEPSVFGYYKDVFVYDNMSNELYFHSFENDTKDACKIHKKAMVLGVENKKCASSIIGCDANKDAFVGMAEKAKEYIFSGDAFQIVLSREYEVSTDLTPFQTYTNLRAVNPSPYMFLLEFDKSVVGSSPEAMATVEGSTIRVNPIAGTAPRGNCAKEDEALAKALLQDEKERAEHVMLVDLARNDVRKACLPGSVRIPTLMEIRRYSHVQHIETEVTGTLGKSKNQYNAMDATFPAGTLTGAPKIRAMEIIDELERSRRKVYGGCVGYFSANGCADMAIAIRMAEFDKVCRVRAGAGIVADSNPISEFTETEQKMSAVMKALGARE